MKKLNELEIIKLSQEEWHLFIRMIKALNGLSFSLYFSKDENYYGEDYERSILLYSKETKQLKKRISRVLNFMAKKLNSLEYTCPCEACNNAKEFGFTEKMYPVDITGDEYPNRTLIKKSCTECGCEIINGLEGACCQIKKDEKNI